MGKIKKSGLIIVALTLVMLALVANNSFADVNFSQLSVYNTRTGEGAVKPVTNALPLLRMEISGITKVTNLKVAVGPFLPKDVKKADLWTYDATETKVLNKEGISPIDDDGVASFTRSFTPLEAGNYAVTVDVVSSVKCRRELDMAVVEVEGINLGTIKKDGTAFGEPSMDNLLNPDGSCLIDFPPMTAQVSKISRFSSLGELIESGKLRSGSSGNEIVFECTAVEPMNNGSAISTVNRSIDQT